MVESFDEYSRRSLCKITASLALGTIAGCSSITGSSPAYFDDREREAGTLWVVNDYESEIDFEVALDGGDPTSVSVPGGGIEKRTLVTDPGQFTVRITRQGAPVATVRMDVVAATERRGGSPLNGDYLTLEVHSNQRISIHIGSDDR